MTQTRTAPPGWGFIGTGAISAVMATNLRALRRGRLAGVAARRATSAAAFAHRYGAGDCKAHPSVAELLADPRVEIVYVAAPPGVHAELAYASLGAGKAVLCEKPMTTAYQDTGTLISFATERGLLLAEAMWMRLNPLTVRAVQLIRDGAIGEVRTIRADFGFAEPPPAFSHHWRPELGGGVLLDVGTYSLTLAHLVLGPPAELTAIGAVGESGVEPEAQLTMLYDCGATARLRMSFVSPWECSAVITGSAGRLVLGDHFVAAKQIVLDRYGSDPELITVPHPAAGYLRQLREVERAHRAGAVECSALDHATSRSIAQLVDQARKQLGLHPVDPILTGR